MSADVLVRRDGTVVIAPHSGGKEGARERGRRSSSCDAEVTFRGSRSCLEDEGKRDDGLLMAEAAGGGT